MKQSPPFSSGLQAALLLLLSCGPALAAPAAQLDWDRSESALVLRYEERSDKLEAAGSLVLELFGDGRVRVTRPEPYARAGTHEARLGPGELQRFLRLVALPEVVAFDEARVREEMGERLRRRHDEEAAAGRGPLLHYRSERERVALELHLVSYRAEPGGEVSAVDQRIEWQGLRLHRAEAPEHRALAALAQAVDRARRLLNDLSSGE